MKVKDMTDEQQRAFCMAVIASVFGDDKDRIYFDDGKNTARVTPA